MNFDLEAPQHGGDLQVWQRQDVTAQNWLDLSSACNREPWPIPEFDHRLWYELPDQYALERAAERYFGHAPLAIGAGSQQFIELLPPLLQAKGVEGSVMVPVPGYQEHGYCWCKWGFDVQEYHSVDELLSGHWRIAVLMQPNNPTAEYLTEAQAEKLRQLLGESERYLVLDEAFADASPGISWLGQDLPERCFVLRSVGKFFGLAGVRVGFLFAHESFRSPVNALLGPWPVATPALHLVTLAFEDQGWQQAARQSLHERHAYFVATIVPKLNTLFDSRDMRATPLFYTWFLASEQVDKVCQALHSVGVHIRRGQGWVRLSLPAGHEMQRLNKALVKLLQGHQLKELG